MKGTIQYEIKIEDDDLVGNTAVNLFYKDLNPLGIEMRVTQSSNEQFMITAANIAAAIRINSMTLIPENGADLWHFLKGRIIYGHRLATGKNETQTITGLSSAGKNSTGRKIKKAGIYYIGEDILKDESLMTISSEHVNSLKIPLNLEMINEIDDKWNAAYENAASYSKYSFIQFSYMPLRCIVILDIESIPRTK